MTLTSFLTTDPVHADTMNNKVVIPANAHIDAVNLHIMEQIATTTLAEAAASITFSSIPATYKHLQLYLSARSTDADADNGKVLMRFNSDTGNNYDYLLLEWWDGAGFTDYDEIGPNYIEVASTPANLSPASVFSSSILVLSNYANTNINKSCSSESANKRNVTGDDGLRYSKFVGYWRSNNAISTILLYLASGDNFAVYTTATLYGIK